MDPDGADHAPRPTRERRRRRRVGMVRVIGAVVFLSLAYTMLPLDASGSSAVISGAVAIGSTLAVVIWQIVVALSSRQAPDEWIERLIVAVPLVMFGFATSYLFLSEADPLAFSEELSRLDAVYFSLMTMTTVGFGDISAQSAPARAFVIAHMVSTVVIVGVAVHLVRAAFAEVQRARPSEDGHG